MGVPFRHAFFVIKTSTIEANMLNDCTDNSLTLHTKNNHQPSHLCSGNRLDIPPATATMSDHGNVLVYHYRHNGTPAIKDGLAIIDRAELANILAARKSHIHLQ